MSKGVQRRGRVELGDLRPQWDQYCERAGITPNEGIRQLVGKVLGIEPRRALRGRLVDGDHACRRVEVRLTHGEYEVLQQLARAAGFSVNRWIVAMIRAQVSAQPQFGEREIAALADSNYHLASIGRNLNQLARTLNARPGEIEPYRLKVLEALKVQIDTHLNNVHEVMRANVDRWSR